MKEKDPTAPYKRLIEQGKAAYLKMEADRDEWKARALESEERLSEVERERDSARYQLELRGIAER